LARIEGASKTELSRLESRLFTKTVSVGLTLSGMVVAAVYFLVLHLKP
jgi:hypothetical protein